MPARSGTVVPCSIARPPYEKSMTTREDDDSGNVYRWTAVLAPTVSSQRIPFSRVAA